VANVVEKCRRSNHFTIGKRINANISAKASGMSTAFAKIMMAMIPNDEAMA